MLFSFLLLPHSKEGQVTPSLPQPSLRTGTFERPQDSWLAELVWPRLHLPELERGGQVVRVGDNPVYLND